MEPDDIDVPLFRQLAQRGEGVDDHVVFVGFPTPGDDEWSETEAQLVAVRRGCERASCDADEPWLLRVRDGDTAPSADALAIRDHIRRELVDTADAAIFLLRAPSYGCGKEVAWATQLGVETLLLAPEREAARPHYGATSWEPPLTVRLFRDAAHVEQLVNAWVTRRRPAIEAGSFRRARALSDASRLRLACARAWNASCSQERDRLARVTFTERRTLVNILSHPSEWAAARTGLTLTLARQLGVWQPDLPSLSEMAELGDREWAALDAAIDNWHFDGAAVSQLIQAALDDKRSSAVLAASGAKQRNLDLASRYGWKQLHDRLAKASTGR